MPVVGLISPVKHVELPHSQWYNVERVVAVVLTFMDPVEAVTVGRRVASSWHSTFLGHHESAFWWNVTVAAYPHMALVGSTVEKHYRFLLRRCPLGSDESCEQEDEVSTPSKKRESASPRRIRLSSSPSATLSNAGWSADALQLLAQHTADGAVVPHVLVVDVVRQPLLWLSRVPVTTTIPEILRIVEDVLGDVVTSLLPVVAGELNLNGIVLAATAPEDELPTLPLMALHRSKKRAEVSAHGVLLSRKDYFDSMQLCDIVFPTRSGVPMRDRGANRGRVHAPTVRGWNLPWLVLTISEPFSRMLRRRVLVDYYGGVYDEDGAGVDVGADGSVVEELVGRVGARVAESMSAAPLPFDET